MAEKVKRRTDVKPELLRTIACFMVILIHIRVRPVVDGMVLTMPVLIGCFLSSSVGVFFLVTGFFMYDGGKSIWKTAKSFLIKILGPTLFVVFMTLVFNNWIMGQATILDSIRQTDYAVVLKSMLDGVLHLSSDYWGFLCAHLWYIAEHARLVLFFPIMVVVVKYAGSNVLIYAAGINVFFCFMIDMYRTFGNFSFLYVEPFLRPSQALVLIGCLLYHYKDRLKEKKHMSVALFSAYVVCILWMYYCQMNQFRIEGGDWPSAYFITWLSGVGMITAILLVAFVMSLPDDLRLWKWVEKPVFFFGDLSFLIYLVQYAIIMKMNTKGISGRFIEMTVTPAGTAAYYFLYGGIIFIISAATAFLMKKAGGILTHYLRKILDNQKTL